MRRRMPQAADRNVFRHTASKSKLINLKPRVMRGGIRL